MYNAMASSDTPGTKGTTRLHMDMADAVNVMLYSAPTPEGEPGCAVWDIYDASDAGKIRDFLKNKFKGKFQNDPIHSQMFYLDCDMRKELFDEFGVKSYRIYQKPGDVVFIPAGCAHQVRSLSRARYCRRNPNPDTHVRCATWQIA
jgi:lysine-specific demethylase 3